MRFFFAAILMSICGVGACDVSNSRNLPVKSQVPSHVSEFMMPLGDYSELLEAFDSTGAQFGLKRFGAAPGLKELHGREVLFAAYEIQTEKGRRGVLDVMDVKGPGKILVWVYEDGIVNTEERGKFVAQVAVIVERHGGKLVPNRKYK